MNEIVTVISENGSNFKNAIKERFFEWNHQCVTQTWFKSREWISQQTEIPIMKTKSKKKKKNVGQY